MKAVALAKEAQATSDETAFLNLPGKIGAYILAGFLSRSGYVLGRDGRITGVIVAGDSFLILKEEDLTVGQDVDFTLGEKGSP
jgi:hypothetical protein